MKMFNINILITPKFWDNIDALLKLTSPEG